MHKLFYIFFIVKQWLRLYGIVQASTVSREKKME